MDASHGGAERGEALTDQLAEKDVTLAFARALRGELEARGINTLMLRDGDATLGLDQRASLANVASPAIYICLHASSQGHGVRLYTALLPIGGSDVGPFLSWDTAQSPFLSLSQAVASSLALELETKQVPVRVLLAPQRPLNNITAAAIAVEVAPPGTGDRGPQLPRLSAPSGGKCRHRRPLGAQQTGGRTMTSRSLLIAVVTLLSVALGAGVYVWNMRRPASQRSRGCLRSSCRPARVRPHGTGHPDCGL